MSKLLANIHQKQARFSEYMYLLTVIQFYDSKLIRTFQQFNSKHWMPKNQIA